jgi:transcriptional regulator with XRE-family HTH domain
MDNETVKFDNLCKSYRAKLGFNMTQAAKMIGVKQSTVSKIEQGEQPASFEYIKKSIEAYQIKDENEKIEFFLAYIKSAKKLEIPVNQLGPLRKEWLAALCVIEDVEKNTSEGYYDLLGWMRKFEKKVLLYKDYYVKK